MRIGLISTIDTNIGDDFIREGLVRALDQVFGPGVRYTVVNKHDPETYYPLAKLTKYLPDGRTRASNWLVRRGREKKISRFDNCDLIVQCGAPVIWPECGRTTVWRDELWYGIIDRLHERIPVLNLAAGSCYPWERQPAAIDDPTDAEYLRRIHGYCRATAVRDPLARDLLASLGLDATFIPCSAMLAPPEPAGPPPAGGPVLINYMERGGHYDWDQNIDAAAWERTVLDLIGRLKGRHPVAFLCHDDKESRLAEALDPSLPRHQPKTLAEYQRVVSGARAALCNRMHASVYMAGLGIPSIAVCTDTRLLMVQSFGLPVHYVKETETGALEGEIEGLISGGAREYERLAALRADVLRRYSEEIRSGIGRSAGVPAGVGR